MKLLETMDTLTEQTEVMVSQTQTQFQTHQVVGSISGYKKKKKEQEGEIKALDKLGSIYTLENIATAYSQQVAARSENLKSWKFKLLCKISWLLSVGN